MPTARNAADTIKVCWRQENREIKGRIVADSRGRAKIVFVHRDFRGRPPRHDELTEAVVVHDTKPMEPSKGALLVRPLYRIAPNALTEDEARARLETMAHTATSERYSFSHDVIIPVEDIPGWEGKLVGRRVEQLRNNNGKLCMSWKFENERGTDTLVLFNGSSPYFVITEGVGWQKHYAYWAVRNWNVAVTDLGLPSDIEYDPATYLYTLTWRDARNAAFRVQVPERETELFQNPPLPAPLPQTQP